MSVSVYVQTLRTLLPRQSGYIIGHAPQPPYFALGYDAVHAKVGSLIDYYALQFYNQGPVSCGHKGEND